MRTRSLWRLPLLLCSALLLGAGGRPPGEASAEPSGAAPREILARALENLYDCDLRSVLDLTLYSRRGEVATRRAEIARKWINGRLYSYGRFLTPPWMRGTAMLIVDNEDRSDEHFLFLPQQDRIRRITSVQRSDSFLGSDLWYEDLERRHPDQYRVLGAREETYRGEPAHVIDTLPIQDSGYQRVEFVIARSDALILKTSYFRPGSDLPLKTIETRREHVLRQDGHVLPTLLVIHNGVRGTRTEARFQRLEINPVLSESLFTSMALESGRPIRGLDARPERPGPSETGAR